MRKSLFVSVIFVRLLLLTTSVQVLAMDAKSCKRMMAKSKAMSPFVFVLAYAEDVAKDCGASDYEWLRATFTSSEIQKISQNLMNACIQKRKDPHVCMPSVNKKMEAVRKLNGGIFGQNDADQKTRRAELERMSKENFERSVLEKQALAKNQRPNYCCFVGSQIVYGDDAEFMADICALPSHIKLKVCNIGGSRTSTSSESSIDESGQR